MVLWSVNFFLEDSKSSGRGFVMIHEFQFLIDRPDIINFKSTWG